jgi:hypothetical protein
LDEEIVNEEMARDDKNEKNEFTFVGKNAK